jgi:EpsI family protein
MLLRSVFATLILLTASAALDRTANGSETALRTPLSELALNFDGWAGSDAARFDARTMELLGVDEYLHRVYVGAAHTPVSLYVGFYGRQGEGETIHSPMNCLPGSGWQPISRTTIPLTVAEPGRPSTQLAEVNQLVIQRGAERQLVVYWYQSHGRVTAGEYTSKLMTMWDAIRLNRTDAALVRLTTPIVERDAISATRHASSFAESLFSRLQAHLPL